MRAKIPNCAIAWLSVFLFVGCANDAIHADDGSMHDAGDVDLSHRSASYLDLSHESMDMATLDMSMDMSTDSDMTTSIPQDDLESPPDEAPMCMARSSICNRGSSACCAGMICEDDSAPPDDMGHVNWHCCLPLLGPASAGCNPSLPGASGCCSTLNKSYCQLQNGIGICCRLIGDLCRVDSDCCLSIPGDLYVHCINNKCVSPF
jgi:hypothetical protein